MKEYYVLLWIALFFLLMSFQRKPITKEIDTIPGFQRENTVSTWGCWVDQKFTRISVIRGEIFIATLQTESLGTLILRGNEKTDSTGGVIQVFGTIENEETHKAIGTFYAERIVPVSEKFRADSMVGHIHLIAPQQDLQLIFTPNP